SIVRCQCSRAGQGRRRRVMRRQLILAAIGAGLGVVACAQPAAPAANPCTDNILAKVRLGIESGSTRAFSNAADPSNITDFIREVIGPEGGSAVCAALTTKTDQQNGSTSSGSGSTSMAQKGAVAELISAAVDNGGLQREVSGTTVTFRGKPIGL